VVGVRRFELRDGKSSKFWSVSLSGRSLTVQFGRIGADGQTQAKTFPSDAAARAEHDRLVVEKVKKGYVEVDPQAKAPSPAPGAAAPAPPKKPARSSRTMGEATHHRVLWEPLGKDGPKLRSSVGGWPILPRGTSWPVCRENGCGKELALFFQIELTADMGLPFPAGSVLSVFQCSTHDDPFEPLDALAPTKS
jgi:predicted DNA-binding WGR domain protein